MDPPVKKKQDRQRRYRARKNAAVDGIEEVRARNRRGATGGSQTQEPDSAKGLEGENDPRGNV